MTRAPVVLQFVSIASAVCVAALTGLAGLLDRSVHDRLTRLLERPYAGSAVIVAIDQASLRELEGWPWPRSRHAALIDRLTAAGARVIAFDIDFSSSSDPDEDSVLARAIRRSGRVLLAAFKEERLLANGLVIEYANVPLPLLAEGAAAVGSILIPVDPDGAVRRVSLRDTIAGETIYAFGLEAARLAAGVPAARLAGPAEGGDLWVDFAAGRPPVVPYADVLAGRVPDEAFRGRIVVVGATALELQDFRPTPLGRITPGVQIQAHVADTLLHGGGPRVVGGPQAGLAALGLALPALLVARGRRRTVGLALAGLPAIVGLALVAGAAHADVRLPAGAFVIAGLATMLAHGVGAWAELAREVARVRARLATLSEFGRRADPSRGPAQSVEIVLEVVRELLGLDAVEVRLAGGSTIRPPSVGDRAAPPGGGIEIPLVASGGTIGQLAAVMPEGRSFGPDERALLEAIASRVAVDSENRSLAADLRSIHLSVIHSLAVAIEMRNAYTGQHCEGVARRAAEIAQALGLDADHVEKIRIGGLLHDIGKIGVPESILLKPGRFTPEEYDLMKQHSAIGHKIISSLPFPEDVKNYVRHHHERVDGTGYPDGLAGEALSLGARIVAVADCYEALVTDRPYRPRVTARDAFGYIKQNRGTHYDPAVVDKLEAILRAQGEDIDW